MTVLSLLAALSAAGLVAVWLLYPLGIGLAAAMVRPPKRPGHTGPTPFVSVVIATRGDAEAIRRRVTNILATSYDSARIEVIVAVSRETFAAVVPAVADMPRVRVVQEDLPSGKTTALNAAVRAAEGEILVFADTFQNFHSNSIAALVAALNDKMVGAATGRLELPVHDGHRSLVERYWIFERWMRRCEGVVHSPVGVTGSIWALRRSLWKPFPPGLLLDDLYAPMVVVLEGHRVAFVESARAVETRRVTPVQEYRRKVRNLTGVMQVCAWLPQVLNPRRNPIWLQFVLHKALRMLTPYWLAIVMCWIAAVMLTSGHGEIVAGGAALLLTLCLFGKGRMPRGAREAVWLGMLMQVALVVGAANGMRRRWDVWSR